MGEPLWSPAFPWLSVGAIEIGRDRVGLETLLVNDIPVEWFLTFVPFLMILEVILPSRMP